MLSPDIALVQLINRTAQAYVRNPPAYITYRERTHVAAPSLGRTQDINRLVKVRQADNFAVMQDLPQGAERTGQAFPIIPYFDPFGGFSFSWFANLKNVDIKIERPTPGIWQIPPADPSVDAVVPYISFWQPLYAADSAPLHMHLRVLPTAALPSGDIYPYDVVVDPNSDLPAHIELRFVGDPTSIVLDYQIIETHWVLTHATYTAPQRFGPLNFTVISDTAYDEIAFPANAPDPRLASTPSPAPSSGTRLH